MPIDIKKKDEFSKLPMSEQVDIVTQQFPNVDRENIEKLIESIDPDQLTYESLELTIQEMIVHGGLGGSLMLITRENNDLRERLDKERKINILLIIGIMLGVPVIGLMLFLFAGYPKYKTVQTVDNSVICEIDPQNNPALTDASIQDFARTAVIAAYSFDYINYRDQLETATTRYFTSEGRTALNRALRNSGSLAHIITNNLIMRTVVTSAAQIEEKAIDNKGQVYWIVRMPITTEFYTGGSKPADVQRFVAQVRIVATTRDAMNTKGIGVHSLTLRPPKSE